MRVTQRNMIAWLTWGNLEAARYWALEDLRRNPDTLFKWPINGSDTHPDTPVDTPTTTG